MQLMVFGGNKRRVQSLADAKSIPEPQVVASIVSIWHARWGPEMQARVQSWVSESGLGLVAWRSGAGTGVFFI